MEKKEMQEMLAEFAKNLNQDKMTEEFKKDFAALKETLEKSEMKFATKEEVKEVMDTLKKFDDVINKISSPNQNSEVKLERELANEIAEKTGSIYVDSIGKILIFFKFNNKDGEITKKFNEFKKKGKK